MENPQVWRIQMKALVIALVFAAPARAEEKPLKSIWAADMPGTRNIRELELRTPGDRRKFGPLMTAIRRQLM